MGKLKGQGGQGIVGQSDASHETPYYFILFDFAFCVGRSDTSQCDFGILYCLVPGAGPSEASGPQQRCLLEPLLQHRSREPSLHIFAYSYRPLFAV